MELVLGLPPLSQYDGAARPMFNSFTDKPDLTPYKLTRAEIDLQSVNDKLAYGAMRSMEMDFTEYATRWSLRCSVHDRVGKTENGSAHAFISACVIPVFNGVQFTARKEHSLLKVS